MLHLNFATAFLLCRFPSCWPLHLDLCQGVGNFLLYPGLTAAPLLVDQQEYRGWDTGAAMRNCICTLAWEHCTDLVLYFVLLALSAFVFANPELRALEGVWKPPFRAAVLYREGTGKTSLLEDRISLSLRKQKSEFIWVVDLPVRVLYIWVHAISCQPSLWLGDLWLLLICSQDVNFIKGGQRTV